MTTTKTLVNFYAQLVFEDTFLKVTSKEKLLEMTQELLEENDISIPQKNNHTQTIISQDEAFDRVHERADSMVDVYNYDLWKKAFSFREFVDETIEEFGMEQCDGILGLLRLGQYQFYNRLGNYILQQFYEYTEEEA